MEQYIDEFGNLQFRAVGTNNDFPFVNISQFAEGVNEGKSIEQIIKENQIKQFNLGTNFGNTQSGFATNFPYQTNVQPVENKTDVTQSTIGQTFEPPFQIIGGQKVYLDDKIGTKAAEEKANFFQQPEGIMTQAKDFLTQTVPKTVKSGLDTLINFIPGMRFIRSLDKFDSLPYQDRKFIKSAMDMKGIVGSGIYVDPSTGLIKDMRGKNVRSLRGNYAENIEKDYNAKVESLEKSKQRWNEKYGDLNNINEYGKTWNEMNKNNLNTFAFLTDMKAKLDKQRADLKEKIKRTESINIHGGPASSADLSAIGRAQYTGEGKAFAPRTDTYTGGKTIDSPSTPGGKYSSPR